MTHTPGDGLKATELMVGNYLMFHPSGRATIKPRPVKIIQIHEETCIVFDKGLPLELFYKSVSTKPIPLTEDWLKAFGFECLHENNKQYVKKAGWQTISFHSTESGWGLGLYDTISNQSYATFCFVNHVHQLQNLYYCLTGTQLTLTDFKQTNHDK